MAWELTKEEAMKLVANRMLQVENIINECKEISEQFSLGFDFPYIRQDDYTENQWRSSSDNC